ncbi:MAG: hypothetical protein SNJ67_06835 [Chloracidobacterium sp.]
MATFSLSLPQALLDEQEALLARIARCREKLNLAMQRARVALSLEDTAEAFFAEQVPWGQRGGAPLRSAIVRPSTTRLTAASRTTGGLPPLPMATPPVTQPTPQPAAVAAVATATAVAVAEEVSAAEFFTAIPWNPGGSAVKRSPWSSSGTSDFLRAATESAIRASNPKN